MSKLRIKSKLNRLFNNFTNHPNKGSGNNILRIEKYLSLSFNNFNKKLEPSNNLYGQQKQSIELLVKISDKEIVSISIDNFKLSICKLLFMNRKINYTNELSAEWISKLDYVLNRNEDIIAKYLEAIQNESPEDY